MNKQAQRRLTGWAIKARRQMQQMSREELALKLQERLEEPFTEHMVSHLENGNKAQAPEILSALSEIQGMPLDWYFNGPGGTSDGEAFNRRSVLLPSDLRIRVPIPA